MKPLIVGQAPSRIGTGEPFTGPSGRRLCELMNLPNLEELKQYFDLDNIIDKPVDKRDRKGDTFPRQLARRSATKLLTREDELGRELIIGCGIHVCRAFGIGVREFFKLYDIGESGRLRLLSFPHPSGISRFWNDRNNVERARTWLHIASQSFPDRVDV